MTAASSGDADPLRIGLVGCGRLAESGYLPALASLAATGRVALAAVADPDPLRREHVARVASRLGLGPVDTHRDAAALLEAGAVDAVVLASPAPAHLADARLAASAGMATLVEKPPAPDAEGAAALAALAPTPWIGFNRRFDPGAGVVRDQVRLALATGAAPFAIRASIAYRRASWGAVSVHDDALSDLGPHLVDWARWLIGSDVTAVRAHHLAPERVILDVALTGGRATLTAATDRLHHEMIEVLDAERRVVARHRLGGPIAAVTGRLTRRGTPALVATLARQLEALADAVGGDPASHLAAELGTAADGLAVMRTIDGARASHALGGATISLDPTPEP